MISIKKKGDFKNFNKFVKYFSNKKYESILIKYAKIGVEKLASETPVDSGETSKSWSYDIIHTKDGVQIVWTNSNVTPRGVPIVILLQYGHSTKNGSFVQGTDFINPVIKDVFEKMAKEIWMEVTSI